MIHVFVYAATIFISSRHLFLVQRITTKQILLGSAARPAFGRLACSSIVFVTPRLTVLSAARDEFLKIK
jgi:hypothetical protein